MDDSVFIQLLSPQRAAFFFHCITKSQVAQREGQRGGEREGALLLGKLKENSMVVP